jgi:hypothetical protein
MNASKGGAAGYSLDHELHDHANLIDQPLDVGLSDRLEAPPLALVWRQPGGGAARRANVPLDRSDEINNLLRLGGVAIAP